MLLQVWSLEFTNYIQLVENQTYETYGRFENPGFYPPKFLGFSFFYRLEKMVVSPDLSFLKTGIQLVVIPGSLQRR